MTNDPAMLIKNRGVFGYVTTFSPDPEVEGDYMFSDESFPMTLYLAPTRDPYRVEVGNINLLDYSILIDFESNTYAVQPMFVDSVFTKGRWLINTRYIPGAGEPNHLYFVLYRGESLTLFKEERVDLLPPTYVEALQVGNRNYTLQPKLKYYCIDHQGNRFDVTKNISDFKKKSSFGQLKKFYKGQSLDFKLEKDILKFATYADSVHAG